MVMTHNMSSVDDAYLIEDKTGLVHLVRFPNLLFLVSWGTWLLRHTSTFELGTLQAFDACFQIKSPFLEFYKIKAVYQQKLWLERQQKLHLLFEAYKLEGLEVQNWEERVEHNMDWGALEKDAYKDAKVIRTGTFENAQWSKVKHNTREGCL